MTSDVGQIGSSLDLLGLVCTLVCTLDLLINHLNGWVGLLPLWGYYVVGCLFLDHWVLWLDLLQCFEKVVQVFVACLNLVDVVDALVLGFIWLVFKFD